MGAGATRQVRQGAVPPLRIVLLGGFRVAIGGAPIPDAAWKLQKARGLLKLLALAPDQRLARDHLLDHLWPAFPPEGAVANLP